MGLARVLWWWLLAVELEPLTGKSLQFAGARAGRDDHAERLTTKFAEEPGKFPVAVNDHMITESGRGRGANPQAL